MARKDFVYNKAYYEAQKGEVKKVLLLYSGGLKTTAILKWIKENYKVEVVTLTLNLGQQSINAEEFKEKALKYGAKKAYVIDVQTEFAEEYITKAIRANAAYEGNYHLSAPLSRAILAEYAIKIAQQEGIECIAHGCGRLSNDLVRLEGLLLTLNPDIKILAPTKEKFTSREKVIEYAEEKQLPLLNYRSVYSYDNNMWGVAAIGGEISKIDHAPDVKRILSRVLPEKANPLDETVTLTFSKGLPTKINGVEKPLADLIKELNVIGAKNMVGITYNVEDLISGQKSRSVYFAPAAEIILSGHKAIERFISTKYQNEYKYMVDTKWSQLCYDGLWLEPLTLDLQAYIESANDKLNGEVVLNLDKGVVTVLSIKTPQTIFEEKLVNFATALQDPHAQAMSGFMQLHTLPMQLSHQARNSLLLSIGKRTNKFLLLPELKKLIHMDYKIYATYKTYKFLKAHHITSTLVYKVFQPNMKPNLSELLPAKRFDLIINIPSNKKFKVNKKEKTDGEYIRDTAEALKIPLITSVEETKAFFKKIEIINK